MPFTAPTPDDLAALDATIHDLSAIRNEAENAEARLTIVRDRIAVPVEPPPPEIVLPAVGVGGSGSFGGLLPATRQKYLALARAAGIVHFRTDFQWASGEPTKGKYNFAGIITRCREIIAAGMIPQVLIGWPPSFYRANPAAGGNSAPTPLGVQAFGVYCRALFAALLPIGVRRFEIWNEPNKLFMQPVSPSVWVDCVLEAHNAAVDISRHIVIVAGGVCPATDTPPNSMSAAKFYDAVVAYEPDFFNFVDEVGTHPYAGDHTKLLDGKFYREQQSHVRALTPAEVPICATEFGWKSVKNTEPERAALYTDSIVSYPDQRAPLFLFSIYDFAEAYGLLTKDGTPKLVYGAIKELLT